MITSLLQLQEVVLGGPLPARGEQDPFLERTHRALSSHYMSANTVGPADIAALLRQGVMRCHLARGDTRLLRVPRASGWPDPALWKRFRCEAVVAGSEHLLVTANPWLPRWLDPEERAVVEDAIAEKPRRQPRFVPADPPLTMHTSYVNYASAGQREAVRAVFFMPHGSTLVINLPTAAGKTLALQLPALSWAAHGGLTFVVVPTVALAREQETRFRDLLSRRSDHARWLGLPLAYHSGLDDQGKQTVRRAVAAGTVPVVFASPEAALGALRGPLFEAARHGRLRYLVLDEAHVVTQWGQDFRPEFQSLAGLRTALLAACPTSAPFRTLLLTATLTAETYATLTLLFGGSNCQLVSENALRTEPAFLSRHTNSEEERQDFLFEAIDHLPRPLILYTTRRDDALAWHQKLVTAGFRRVRLIRGGDLSEPAGAQILREWRDRDVDIIVATSAFGLGVDQPDVRTVVHACLPESLDRYYQEVGRGGRDGHAAVALLLTTNADHNMAKNIGRDTLITIDRGHARWREMWLRGRPGEDGTYVISLDSRPPDLASTSDLNASWNLRTLVLMVQAGLIELASHPPPDVILDPESPDPEARRRDILAAFYREVSLHVRDPEHLDREHWNDTLAPARRALQHADEEGSRLLLELLAPTRPLNEVFRDLYTLQGPPLSRPPRFLGSCPVTRQRGIVSFAVSDPSVLPLARVTSSLSPTIDPLLAPARDDTGRCWITYDPPRGNTRDVRRWRDSVRTFLRHMVAHGILEFALPEGLLTNDEWQALVERAPMHFLVRGAHNERDGFSDTVAAHLPRLSLIWDQVVALDTIAATMRLHRPRHLIILPRDAPDPRRPDRHLLDVLNHLPLDTILRRLEG